MSSRIILEEKLIELVKKHEALYNTDMKAYTDNGFKLKIWRKIAVLCGLASGDEAKKQWKNLRDGYRTALKMYKANSVADASGNVKTWKYFEQMSFLRPYIKDRRKNLQEDDSEENSLFDENFQDIVKEEAAENFEIPMTFFNEESGRYYQDDNPGPSKRQCLSNSEQLEEISNSRQFDGPKDSLKLFFDSMYASTKALPPRLQRVVKNKLFQAVNDAEIETETSQQPTDETQSVNGQV